MATAPSSIKLSGLARSLIQEKLLSEEEAQAIQSQANAAKNPFITQLILSKKLNPQIIAQTSTQAIKLYFLAAACKARSISLYGCAPNMRLPSAKIKVGVLVISNDFAKSPTFSKGTSQFTAFLGS